MESSPLDSEASDPPEELSEVSTPALVDVPVVDVPVVDVPVVDVPVVSVVPVSELDESAPSSEPSSPHARVTSEARIRATGWQRNEVMSCLFRTKLEVRIDFGLTAGMTAIGRLSKKLLPKSRIPYIWSIWP